MTDDPVIWASTLRMTDEEIERERSRFDKAQELIAGGKVEAARKVWWWPRNRKPPKVHWSRVSMSACFCGRNSPLGGIGLCRYCGGTTPQTPDSIPRKRSS